MGLYVNFTKKIVNALLEYCTKNLKSFKINNQGQQIQNMIHQICLALWFCFLLTFQKGNSLISTNEVVFYQGQIPTLTKLTICYWEFVRFFGVGKTWPFSYCHEEKESKRILCTQIILNPVLELFSSKVFS